MFWVCVGWPSSVKGAFVFKKCSVVLCCMCVLCGVSVVGFLHPLFYFV